MIDPTASIHELAVVEDGAVVGAGTRIWHHAHVRGGAVIGAGTNISKDVYVAEDVRIGDRCKLQNGVFACAGVTLGDEVFVGPNAVFTNDLFPRAQNPGWVLVRTTVERGASVGANATVICGNTIGAFAMVGAGSVVTRSLEPHELVVGNPARRIGWVCECGKIAARGHHKPDDLRCDGCRAAEAAT